MYTPTKEEVRAALNMHEKAFERALKQWGMTTQAFDELATQYGFLMTVEDWQEELQTLQRLEEQGVFRHLKRKP
ncbi:MAG: hypothetical protein HC828_03385 [Blastochloris sp.]|nr:hypothetical protein [Blastochloris sp.]